MSFSEKYKKIYSIVEKEITQIKEEVLSDISNSFELTSDLTNLFNSPSKHIRAVLALLYLKANNVEITKKQIKFQAIIEFIHNGSLIHDDIIDNSKIRRNAETINSIHGNHLSVIAGDLVLSFALKKISELKSDEITNIVAKTITNMCKGEINQYYSKYKIPTEEQYIEKTYNKTGSLFETTIIGAAILSKKISINNAADFGKNFGIAFQIRDDIKNIEKCSTSDSDIENGIYTAPIIYSNNPEDPFSGIEKAKDLLDNYICKSKIILESIPQSEYKSAIIELLELINNE